MNNPRELPILFNADMVRAILAGTKTQTRRPISRLVRHGECKILLENGKWKDWWKVGDVWHSGRIYKPKYQIGDRLYVRESARLISKKTGSTTRYQFNYDADGINSEWMDLPERIKDIPDGHCVPNGCFKELARIWLEVVDVRVERVQDIKESGARAEGVESKDISPDLGFAMSWGIGQGGTHGSYKAGFEDVWDSIYKNWDKNPWVFVYEFKVVSNE